MAPHTFYIDFLITLLPMLCAPYFIQHICFRHFLLAFYSVNKHASQSPVPNSAPTYP